MNHFCIEKCQYDKQAQIQLQLMSPLCDETDHMASCD